MCEPQEQRAIDADMFKRAAPSGNRRYHHHKSRSGGSGGLPLRAQTLPRAGIVAVVGKEGGGRHRQREAFRNSRLRLAMLANGMPFGQEATHSPVLVQPPKSSLSMAATMSSTRCPRSGWPCGNTFR